MSHKKLLRHTGLSRSGFEFVVRTDIADFYSSIYTHSIPWALHTKAVAKAKRRDKSLLGNVLDRFVQRSQDDQTAGIPIGPDTSLIIAEIVATAVDNRLARRSTGLRGYRHYDDYELWSNKESEARELVSTLQDELHQFELRLNASKTHLLHAPTRLEEEWVSVLRRFEIRTGTREEADDLIRYFDLSGDYARRCPTTHVMKFSLGRFRWHTASAPCWALLQSLLCQAVVSDPSAISQFVAALDLHQRQGNQLSRDLIEPLLNNLIREYSAFHFHEELSWALWAILAFGFTVDREAARAIARVDNSMVALLALDAVQQGRVDGGIDTSEWEKRMVGDELFQEQWLLCYEANIKAWLPSIGGTDHVLADPHFRELKNRAVEFYSPVIGTGALAESLVVREEWPY